MAEVTCDNGDTQLTEGPFVVDTVPQSNAPTIEEKATTTPLNTTNESIANLPPTETPSQDMPASEGLVPSDLTMDSNPMTTANPPSIEHIDKNTANLIGKAVAEPSQRVPSSSVIATGGRLSPTHSSHWLTTAGAQDPSDHGDADEGSSEATSPPAMSATGWLVPPAKTPTSKITFDGTLPFSSSVHTLLPLGSTPSLSDSDNL